MEGLKHKALGLIDKMQFQRERYSSCIDEMHTNVQIHRQLEKSSSQIITDLVNTLKATIDEINIMQQTIKKSPTPSKSSSIAKKECNLEDRYCPNDKIDKSDRRKFSEMHDSSRKILENEIEYVKGSFENINKNWPPTSLSPNRTRRSSHQDNWKSKKRQHSRSKSKEDYSIKRSKIPNYSERRKFEDYRKCRSNVYNDRKEERDYYHDRFEKTKNNYNVRSETRRTNDLKHNKHESEKHITHPSKEEYYSSTQAIGSKSNTFNRNENNNQRNCFKRNAEINLDNKKIYISSNNEERKILFSQPDLPNKNIEQEIMMELSKENINMNESHVNCTRVEQSILSKSNENVDNIEKDALHKAIIMSSLDINAHENIYDCEDGEILDKYENNTQIKPESAKKYSPIKNCEKLENNTSDKNNLTNEGCCNDDSLTKNVNNWCFENISTNVISVQDNNESTISQKCLNKESDKYISESNITNKKNCDDSTVEINMLPIRCQYEDNTQIKLESTKKYSVIDNCEKLHKSEHTNNMPDENSLTENMSNEGRINNDSLAKNVNNSCLENISTNIISVQDNNESTISQKCLIANKKSVKYIGESNSTEERNCDNSKIEIDMLPNYDSLRNAGKSESVSNEEPRVVEQHDLSKKVYKNDQLNIVHSIDNASHKKIKCPNYEKNIISHENPSSNLKSSLNISTSIDNSLNTDNTSEIASSSSDSILNCLTSPIIATNNISPKCTFTKINNTLVVNIHRRRRKIIKKLNET